MTKKELKKEFKKLCKLEKSSSYKYMILGNITAILGLLIMLIAYLINKEFSFQNLLFILGALVSVIGGILDIISEITLTKNFKKYINEL